MRSEEEAVRAVESYGDMVRRLCVVQLQNYADIEDVFQTVFLKYVLSSRVFEGLEQEKAWLLRVALNACRDVQRSLFRRRTVSMDQAEQLAAPEGDREVIWAVQTLPEKYRSVVYLHYYEGYTAPEIGKLLGKNPNTVYTWLNRAKALLREALGGDGDEG